MPRWHWIYRDFVEFAKNVSDDNWNQCFDRYVKQNWSLLYRLHFDVKGFASYEQVRERYQSIDWNRYAALIKALDNHPSFEHSMISMVDQLCKRLEYEPADREVYVIVGLDCTNIYATELDGYPVTVLCLEATFGDMKELELLLAHEAHHWKRQSLSSHDIFESSAEERCVTEGLAIHFSEEVQPWRPMHEYCFVPHETVAWVELHVDEMASWLRLVEANDTHAISMLFSRHPEQVAIVGMPPRTGYAYGYLVVKDYLRAATSAAEVAGIGHEAVFGWRQLDIAD